MVVEKWKNFKISNFCSSEKPIKIIKIFAGGIWSLTAGADAGAEFTGTSGNDTFVATEATLSSADSLDGAGGDADTLKYSSSGNVAVNEAGFEAKGIENVIVTSDAAGGTTFDVTGVTDLKKIQNYNSSQNLNITGLKSIVDVEVIENGQPVGAGAPSTIFQYDIDAVSGNADVQNLKLSNNLNTDGTAIGAITFTDGAADGVETVNITSTEGASTITNLVSPTLATVNVEGDADLTVTGLIANATTINAGQEGKEFTGNLSVVVDSGNRDVVVTGGKGNDRADFSAGWDQGDSFDGGEGRDTIGMTYAIATNNAAVNAGTFSEVEILDITDAANANGTVNMANFDGVDTVIFNRGINAGTTATVSNAPDNLTIRVDVDAQNSGSLVTTLATNGTSDVQNFIFNNVGNNANNIDTLAALSAANAETLNITVNDDAATLDTGTLTITNLTATQAQTLKIDGNANLNIANTVDSDAVPAVTSAITTIDASEAIGGITIRGTDLATSGATVILGQGNDTFIAANMNGADVIDLTKGGNDRIVYSQVAQSDRDMDVIKGFQSGSDVIDVHQVMGALDTNGNGIIDAAEAVSSTNWAGNRATFALAQGALTTTDATPDIVFQQDEQILWVDVNVDGTLDNNDFRVKLEGVTSLTEADLGFPAGGITFTAQAAGFNTTTGFDGVNNVAPVTNQNDTINVQIGQQVGSTINGLGGTDTLNLSGTAAANENMSLTNTGNPAVDLALLANIEIINMDNALEGIILGAGDFNTVTQINGVAGVNQTVNFQGGGINFTGTTFNNIEILNENNNIVSIVTFNQQHFNSLQQINLGGGADTVQLRTGTYDLSNVQLNFGGGGDTLDLDLLGFDTGSKTVTLDAADIANVTTITGEATAGAITQLNFNDSVDLGAAVRAGGVTDIDVVTLGGTNQTLRLDGSGASGLTAIQFTTITGSGDSNLTLLQDANMNLTNTTISGFDSIDVSAAATNRSITFDATSVNTADQVTWVGSATTDLVFTQSYDASNWTITAGNFDDVTLNAGVALTVSENFFIGAINAIDGNAAGNETLTINMSGNTLDLTGVVFGGVSLIEALNINDTAGNDQITIDLVNGGTQNFTVNLNGGQDVITIDNTSIDNATGVVTINGFGTDDQLVSQVNNASIVTAVYYVADSANKVSGLTNGDVIEIHSLGNSGVSIANPNSDASLVAALNAVLTNGGTNADIANGNYTVVGYNGNNGYVYQVSIVGNDGTAGGDDTVELIGILNNVGADVLTAANFA